MLFRSRPWPPVSLAFRCASGLSGLLHFRLGLFDPAEQAAQLVGQELERQDVHHGAHRTGRVRPLCTIGRATPVHDAATIAKLVKQAGLTRKHRTKPKRYRRTFVVPRPGDLVQLDAIVEDATKWQTNLLLSVVAAPRWATDNGLHGMPSRAHFATFNYFMAQMASRYAGRVKAYEIWNEQNLATENGGTVSDVGYYMDMLVGAAQAVHAEIGRAHV